MIHTLEDNCGKGAKTENNVELNCGALGFIFFLFFLGVAKTVPLLHQT